MVRRSRTREPPPSRTPQVAQPAGTTSPRLAGRWPRRAVPARSRAVLPRPRRGNQSGTMRRWSQGSTPRTEPPRARTPGRSCRGVGTATSPPTPNKGAGRISRDQQWSHVVRDRHRADQDDDHEQQRPNVSEERAERVAAAGKALGKWLPRMKKNQAAPTISQRRPISDVSWGELGNSDPTAPTSISISTRNSVAPTAGPNRLATLLARPSKRDSIHESDRPSGWRRNATRLKASMPNQR